MTATTSLPTALASLDRDEADRFLTQATLEMLAASHHLALRFVRCRVRSGVVELHGRVATFHLKQMAQSLAGKLPAAQAVRNHLVVD